MFYDRGPPEVAEQTCAWEAGVSWIAHPDERGERASHAVETDTGVWLVDPLDATNLEAMLDPLGEVVGVVVLSSWHARDAGALARRHDVAVHVPTWMGRVPARVDAPVERYTLAPADGFRVLSCRPFPTWQEAMLYHGATGTLFVPDSLGTVEHWCLANERLGLPPFRRPQPPVQLRGLTPDRVLVGHGEPVTERAAGALADALDGARWTFPRALVETGRPALHGVLAAVRN
jgi:hypothetical protein